MHKDKLRVGFTKKYADEWDKIFGGLEMVEEKKTAYNDYHNIRLKAKKVVDWRKDIEERLAKLEKIIKSDFRLKKEYRGEK